MTAATIDVLKREVKVLMFDQYGTVVDMQQGLIDAVTPFLRDKGWDGEPHRFVTWWRRTHYENSMIDALCDRGHTPYRQIGHRSVVARDDASRHCLYAGRGAVAGRPDRTPASVSGRR